MTRKRKYLDDNPPVESNNSFKPYTKKEERQLKRSARTMELGRALTFGYLGEDIRKVNSKYFKERLLGNDDNDINNEGYNAAQSTFLVSPELQEKVFLNRGYKRDNNNDYGLVSKAVNEYEKETGKKVPVYQRFEDDIDREHLIPIKSGIATDDPNKAVAEDGLIHAGDHPYAVYIGTDGNVYYKSWDFNDYGVNENDLNKYRGDRYSSKFSIKARNRLNRKGNPTVVTTGFKRDIYGDYPYTNNINSIFTRTRNQFFKNPIQYGTEEQKTKYENGTLEEKKLIEEEVFKEHAKPIYADEIFETTGGKYIPELGRFGYISNPIDVYGKKIKKLNGGSIRRSLRDGGIYIKPSHRGKFTALKERTGHSTSWFKENGTPAQKKMATFALNAAKWNH